MSTVRPKSGLKSDRSLDYQSVLNEYGAEVLRAKVKERINEWKTHFIRIGVMSAMEFGPVSLIRDMCEIQSMGQEYRGTNYSEGLPKLYPFLNNRKIVIWNIPPFERQGIQPDTFITKMRIETFDYLLIYYNHVLSRGSLQLAKRLREIGVAFSFVRDDLDKVTARTEKDGMPTKNVIPILKSSCLSHLKFENLENVSVFIISNKSNGDDDFQDFLNDMLQAMPLGKRETFILSLPSLTKEIVLMKKSVLDQRVPEVAIASSSLVSSSSLPTTRGIDLDMLADEMQFYMHIYRIDEEILSEICRMGGMSESHKMVDDIYERGIRNYLEGTLARDLLDTSSLRKQNQRAKGAPNAPKDEERLVELLQQHLKVFTKGAIIICNYAHRFPFLR